MDETKTSEKRAQSNKMKFDDDDDDEKNIIVRYTLVKVLLLSFQVQHSAYNLFEQIKIITIVYEPNKR